MKHGGRGASSHLKKNQKIFKNNDERGGAGKTKSIPNAQANVAIKNKTEKSALNYFASQYKDADIEHGFEIDSNGYVWQNLVGTSNSVGLGANHEQAGITIHNHPMDSGQKDYSHFSGTDLRTFARNKKEKTMYVVSKKATYKIKKGTQFDRNGFVDAMKKAKTKSNSSYDAAVDNFLTQNQRKYHYVYTKTK